MPFSAAVAENFQFFSLCRRWWLETFWFSAAAVEIVPGCF
jgi:hypothetical protein